MIMDPVKHVRRPRQKPDWRGPTLAMAGGVLALWLAAPAPAQMLLPAPEGAPQAIAFGNDPLLGFLARDSGTAGFRAAVAEAVARQDRKSVV